MTAVVIFYLYNEDLIATNLTLGDEIEDDVVYYVFLQFFTKTKMFSCLLYSVLYYRLKISL